MAEEREIAVEGRSYCPYCQSTRVAKAGKQTSTTYFRCEACGQLWHPRRLPPHRFRGGDR